MKLKSNNLKTMDIIGAICYHGGFAPINKDSCASQIMSYSWKNHKGEKVVSYVQSRAANYANNHK